MMKIIVIKNLIKSLNLVNESYRERIRLQLLVEQNEGYIKSITGITKEMLKIEDDVYKRAQAMNVKLNLGLKLDPKNVEANEKVLLKYGSTWEKFTNTWFSDSKIFNNLEKINDELITEQALTQQTLDHELNKGKATEDQVQNIKDYNKNLEESVKLAKSLGGVAGKDFSDMNLESVEKFIKSKSPKTPTGEEEKTKEQLKAEKDKELFDRAEKEINEILKRSIEQRELQILQGYAREEAQINFKYDREKEKYASHAEGLKQIEEARTNDLNALKFKAETEIVQLVETSQRNIANNKLKGFAREEALITQRYAKEAEKYKGQTELLKRLEAQRDAELEALRLANLEESSKRAKEIEDQNRIEELANRYDAYEEIAKSAEERQLILIEKAREVALLEIEIEQEKELEKLRIAEASAEEIAAVKQKYALQESKVRSDFDKAEKVIRSQQVDWTRLTEEQKLNAIKSSLGGAAEAFNEGSGAWKASKIAETTITTYQSATNAFNSLSGIPIVGPALGAAAAALAVVTGLKNIQKISSTPLNKMPTFYYGGYTGNRSNGMGGDEYGQFTGAVHANE